MRGSHFEETFPTLAGHAKALLLYDCSCLKTTYLDLAGDEHQSCPTDPAPTKPISLGNGDPVLCEMGTVKALQMPQKLLTVHLYAQINVRIAKHIIRLSLTKLLQYHS